MATVLVIGASKGICLATVQAALKSGHFVRALARTATAIRIDHPKLEKVDGDARDRHTIEAALTGVEAIIQTLGVTPEPRRIISGTQLFSTATRVLVAAMENSPVKRLICVTGLGAGTAVAMAASSTMPRFASSLGGFAPTRMCRNTSFAAVNSTGQSFVLQFSQMDRGRGAIVSWAIRATGPPGLSPALMWPTSWSSRSTTRAFCTRPPRLPADAPCGSFVLGAGPSLGYRNRADAHAVTLAPDG